MLTAKDGDSYKKVMAYIEQIKPADFEAMKDAEERQKILAKPPGALGELENISIKLAGITGKVKNHIKKPAIIICCSDNGVWEEGISSTPQSVTYAQTMNFTRGKTGVAAMAKNFRTDLCVIDLGVIGTFPKSITSNSMSEFSKNVIINRKISMGTKNLAKESAMTLDEASEGILSGIEAVNEAKKQGYDIIGTGEMGIGNTTTSSCLLTAITGCSAESAVGRGGGLSDEGLKKKLDIVKKTQSRRKYNDIIELLSDVGGYDICGLVGVFLGCAKNRIPVVIDGYISAVAFLCATSICKHVKDFAFTSHISSENGYKIAMNYMGMRGILDLSMRLGEGSGCVLAFEIIKAATYAINDMATYEEAKIDENYLELIKDAKF